MKVLAAAPPPEPFLAWDPKRVVPFPYSVHCSGAKRIEVRGFRDRKCSVRGCATRHPEHQKYGESCTLRLLSSNLDARREVACVLQGMCNKHYLRAHRLSTSARSSVLSVVDLARALGVDAGLHGERSIFKCPDVVVREQVILRFQSNGNKIPVASPILYERDSNELPWRRVTSMAPGSFAPETICLCGEATVPVRTARLRIQFREHMLKAIHKSEVIRMNQVLFVCRVCHERFPTFILTICPPIYHTFAETRNRCLDGKISRRSRTPTSSTLLCVLARVAFALMPPAKPLPTRRPTASLPSRLRTTWTSPATWTITGSSNGHSRRPG